MIKLFLGLNYYPDGGYDDFKGSFDDIESAKEWVEKEYSEAYFDGWAHLVLDDKIILRGYRDSSSWDVKPWEWWSIND